MPKPKIRPRAGDLWRRKVGTLPNLRGFSRMEMPAEREEAHVKEVGRQVSYRRDSEDKPATHLLDTDRFQDCFELIRRAPVRYSNASSTSAAMQTARAS